jgi:pyrroline-5-carboxylate reductase
MLSSEISMSRKHEPAASHPPVIAEGATLGVIGAGVMGQTLIRGLVASGLIARARLWAGDKNATVCQLAAQELRIPVEVDYQKRVPTADLILVCVKPADAPAALASLLAAGLRRETLASLRTT